MSKLFNTVQVRKPRRNAFDLSHEKKLSLNMGELIPFYLQETVPGDSFKVNTEILMRLAPMVAPVMHRVNVFTHYFFVPNRLVYGEWEKFITGGEDGQQIPPFPTLNLTGGEGVEPYTGAGSLLDYMGGPVHSGVATSKILKLSALPFRAYQLIYNEYYRDQNLTAAVPITKDSVVAGGEILPLLTIRKRAWEKDYFTSALPWAQRGGEVELPTDINYMSPAQITSMSYPGEPATPGAAYLQSNSYDGKAQTNLSTAGGMGTVIENISSIGTTINDLRRATRLQEWLEKNARAGSRYIEQIWSHFGVRSSDGRLQRPQYLGGGKQPVVISEVLSTYGNGVDTVQGNMSGHGISVGNQNFFKKSIEEHGYIFGIMSVIPRTTYQQGVDRQLQKFDKFDYFWPEFANLGEQEVLLKELYFDWETLIEREDVFGYQSRYAEYKYKQSSVHGDFRDTLDFWHMGRKFANVPALNTSFVESDPTERVFAVTDENVDKLYVQVYNDVKAIRPMPTFGTPTL